MILVDSTPEIYKGWLEHAVQRALAGQTGRLAAGRENDCVIQCMERMG